MVLIGKRKLDGLGRVALPKEFRNHCGWDVYTDLEIHSDGETIVLKKARTACVFCQSETGLFEYRGQSICAKCRDDLQAHNNPASK